jgi:hypothetical protein
MICCILYSRPFIDQFMLSLLYFRSQTKTILLYPDDMNQCRDFGVTMDEYSSYVIEQRTIIVEPKLKIDLHQGFENRSYSVLCTTNSALY